jgi:G6PDH family F420-dependent oxidoreductase
MTELAYAISSEEHDARSIVDIAKRVEAAGFRSVWISDHYHPWIDRQGEAPFVWSAIGAIGATTQLKVTTGVTCPTFRTHPAIIAHAAATSSNLLGNGRFRLGVGSGEALNEHILGDRWPPAEVRLDRLAEAIELMRRLWTGKSVTHRGRHFTVEDARIYTGPDGEIPVLVSAFGKAALRVATEHGDGWVTTSPDDELMRLFRQEGRGPACGAFKVCYGDDEAKARRLAYELWPTSGIPGQLHQDLPTPTHFQQAASIVTEEDATAGTPCGPDPEPYVATFREYADLGYDEVAITPIGQDVEGFLRFYEKELRPRLGL